MYSNQLNYQTNLFRDVLASDNSRRSAPGGQKIVQNVPKRTAFSQTRAQIYFILKREQVC
jgi:hypothetical protein